MSAPVLLAPGPIDTVLFDFHSTLVDPGAGEDWLRAATERAEREFTPVSAETLHGLDFFWERARVVDPENTRDLSPERHHEVFRTLVADVPGLDEELRTALHETQQANWSAYADTRPTLEALRSRGVRVVLLSNASLDIRPIIERCGLSDLVDAVVVSAEVGSVKPHPAIFAAAMDTVGARPETTLMVGDAWGDDAGAAALGIRTLILPRTPPPTHGLHLVTALVDASRHPAR